MHRRTILSSSAIGVLYWGFGSSRVIGASEDPISPVASQAPRKGLDCSSIFTTLDAWVTLEGEPVRVGWQIKDGEIFLNRSAAKAGHIVTKKEYGDFELSFDWKIDKGGNSGIKYRVRKYGDRTLGCEYQIYDPNGKPVDGKNKTAALYDLYAPDESAQLFPPGEWNTAKIVVYKDTIEHWLNGKRVVQAVVGDKEWERRIAESKFNDAQRFSKNRCGRIMLTDHGSDVYYRNFVFNTFETDC